MDARSFPERQTHTRHPTWSGRARGSGDSSDKIRRERGDLSTPPPASGPRVDRASVYP